VFSPFMTNRRLSNIAEEDGSEVSLGRDDSESRENARTSKMIQRSAPSRNKVTPTRIRHRFQRLVELDYRDGRNQEDYEPPEDFLQVQKLQQSLFYKHGRQEGTMVIVNENTDSDDGTLKIFQFAADTASLSRSCSSDSASVVSSTTTGCQQRMRRQVMESTNGNDHHISMPVSPNVDARSIASSSDMDKTTGMTNFQETISPHPNAPKPAKTTKLNPSKKSGEGLFKNRSGASSSTTAEQSVKESLLSVNQQTRQSRKENSLEFDPDGYHVFSTPSAQMTPSVNGEAFETVEWPTKVDFVNPGTSNGRQEPVKPIVGEVEELHDWSVDFGFPNTQTVKTVDHEDTDAYTVKTTSNFVDEQGWPANFFFNAQNEIKEDNTTSPNIMEGGKASAFSTAKSTIERSEELLLKTDAMLNKQVARSAKDIVESQHKHGDSYYEPNMANPVKEATSAYKENEVNNGSIGSNRMVRNRKVQFQRMERQHSNALVKLTDSVETMSIHSGYSWNPPILNSDGTVDRKRGKRPNVSLRFEFTDERPASSRHGEKEVYDIKAPGCGTSDSKRAPDTVRPVPEKPVATCSAVANLGAVSMSSPHSMHLFYDRTNSIDVTINRTSTIDSIESNSTATSVSTFIDASPRGIRGGFPDHLAASTSSLSTSQASSNLINEVDYLMRTNGPATGDADNRPPTGVPPTSILGSMLFQSPDSELPLKKPSKRAQSSTIRNSKPPVRGVPKAIIATADAAVSDVTGSTAASDWMVQGNKLLNRYYHSTHDGATQKEHKVSRHRQKREKESLQECQIMLKGVQRQRNMQAYKVLFTEFVSEREDKNDSLDKMRGRHQQSLLQYPDRKLRSGFDNIEDDDADSLFEA